MWLVTTAIAALVVTAIYMTSPKGKDYNFHWLSIMLWGATVMILVDHLWEYNWTSPFLELRTDGLIADGALLGVVMLLPVFALWEVSVLLKKNRVAS